MCAARMVMQHWARGYTRILLKAGLKIPLMTGYVNDGRQGSTVLRKGMRFDEGKGEFAMDVEQFELDAASDEPDNMSMARICLPAMNAVNRNLIY
jgi:Cft2 family RNA processing exonuclease